MEKLRTSLTQVGWAESVEGLQEATFRWMEEATDEIARLRSELEDLYDRQREADTA